MKRATRTTTVSSRGCLSFLQVIAISSDIRRITPGRIKKKPPIKSVERQAKGEEYRRVPLSGFHVANQLQPKKPQTHEHS
jgi:hypothetical protein